MGDMGESYLAYICTATLPCPNGSYKPISGSLREPFRTTEPDSKMTAVGHLRYHPNEVYVTRIYSEHFRPLRNARKSLSEKSRYV